MLSSKISAQTLVFFAFFPFITIPTAKPGLNDEERFGIEIDKPDRMEMLDKLYRARFSAMAPARDVALKSEGLVLF